MLGGLKSFQDRLFAAQTVSDTENYIRTHCNTRQKILSTVERVRKPFERVSPSGNLLPKWKRFPLLKDLLRT